MKKLTALILALVMAMSFAACAKTEQPAEETPSEDLDGNESVSSIEEVEGQSEDKEGMTAIPMGGNIGDFNMSAAGFEGKYVEIEIPENLKHENNECHLYYCETNDCRYISTYRWAKNGITLEEEAKNEQQVLGWVSPQFASWEDLDFSFDIGVTETASLYGGGSFFDDGEFYFTEVILFEDGDDFVEICFDNVATEIELGETGEYIWIPTGYADVNTEEFTNEYGVIVFAEYPEEYYYPHISVAQPDDYYKFEQWFREDSFPDGLPVTREQYDKWCEAEWDEKSFKEYAEAFGFNNPIYGKSENELGNTVEFIAGQVDEIYLEVTYIEVNGEWFNICTGSPLHPTPKYSKAIAASIHTK